MCNECEVQIAQWWELRSEIGVANEKCLVYHLSNCLLRLNFCFHFLLDFLSVLQPSCVITPPPLVLSVLGTTRRLQCNLWPWLWELRALLYIYNYCFYRLSYQYKEVSHISTVLKSSEWLVMVCLIFCDKFEIGDILTTVSDSSNFHCQKHCDFPKRIF